MTSAERRALLFLSAVAVLGAGVRAVRGRADAAAPTVEGRQALARHIQRVDSAERTRGRASRPKRAPRGEGRKRAGRVPRASGDSSSKRAPPIAEATPVDLDVADAAEIERLPRIGPALARRIVASRDSLGPFGEIAAVERVRGVGPKLAAAIAPHVTFSGRRRPSIAVPALSQGASPGRPSHRPRT
jgi:DNA uptake protein ComE-like DNA-binding protein